MSVLGNPCLAWIYSTLRLIDSGCDLADSLNDQYRQGIWGAAFEASMPMNFFYDGSCSLPVCSIISLQTSEHPVICRDVSHRGIAPGTLSRLLRFQCKSIPRLTVMQSVQCKLMSFFPCFFAVLLKERQLTVMVRWWLDVRGTIHEVENLGCNLGKSTSILSRDYADAPWLAAQTQYFNIDGSRQGTVKCRIAANMTLNKILNW